jgi:uncharacterized membrane protein YdjX (TVP38/TMEM64 family)
MLPNNSFITELYRIFSATFHPRGGIPYNSFMRLSRKNTIQLVKWLLIIISFFLALKFFLIPIVISEQFRQFTQSLGIFGYLIVIGYTTLSHVFAPLAGTPGVVLGVTIYGIRTGMVLLYIASLISASINFMISRKYGRKIVMRFVGDKSMKEIDEFTSVEGKQVLWLSRIFGFPIFEFISYAAGLTNIPFKDYILITAIAHSISSIAGYLVFKNIDFQSEVGIAIWIGSIVIAGIVFSFFIKSYLKTKKNNSA